MAPQIWPTATLPTSPMAGSYSETPQPFRGSFTPDVGPDSHWPRSSTAMLECSWRLHLTAEQRLALIAFWNATCKQGSLPFRLADPITGTLYTWYWASSAAPSISGLVGKTNFVAEIRAKRWLT